MTDVCHSIIKLHGYFSCLLIRVLLIGIMIVAEVAAKVPDIRFETPFDSSQLISQQLGAVNSILNDHLGFIWIGAENGLARYDGRGLKLYQADPANIKSLPASYIWQVVVDHDGVLWMATEGGLARYNAETDDFTHVRRIGDVSIATESVSALVVAGDNTLFVGSARELYSISPDRQVMKSYSTDPPVAVKEPNMEQIRYLAIDDQQRVWVATAGLGVAIFSPADGTFDYLVHDPANPQSIAHNSVRSILHDNRGRTWLGTYGGGVSLLDRATGRFEHFRAGDAAGSLKSDVVWDIAQDSRGTIWLLPDQAGLAFFDEQTHTFHHYLHRPYDPTSLVSNQLRVIFEDKNQDIWVGGAPSGISFYNRSTQIFRHFTTKPADPNTLSNNAVLRIIEASNGIVWIGTEGGLNALNPETDEITRYVADPKNPHALNANAVLAIQEDVDGQLWIGTWAGGLHRFNPETGIFKRYLPDDNDETSINSTFIWDIHRDRHNNIWIGTETGGLNLYHRETDSFTHFIHDPKNPQSISGNFITTLLEDRKGHLWIGSYVGVNIFDPSTGIFTRVPYETGNPDATNSKNSKSLYEDIRGRIWIGTQHRGVNIYDPESGSFTYMDIHSGLPSSNVASILEDDLGYVWLATANGLVSIEPGTGAITLYGKEEGLAGSSFNREAALRDRGGNLYFGSSEGVTRFHPDKLDDHSTLYPVRITHFRLFNRDVAVGPESPLHKSITLAEEITLSYKDIMFSFDFAALNYRNADSIRYSYRLEGFDQGWNDIGRQATATYTNISPGEHVFRTRASVDGIRWVEGQSIKITILPPPWRTWWAYSFYAALIFAALYLRNSHVKLRTKAEAYKTKSITDPLTDLYNRLGVAQIAEGIFSNSETKRGMGVMLLDIDHFKRVNDRRGHDAGDRVLIDIARIILKCIRHNDHLGRWGGEEFVLLYAAHNQESSLLLAEKIRTAVDNEVFENGVNPLRVTVSIGVAMILPEDTFNSALKRADIALYQAKARGRNCIVMAD